MNISIIAALTHNRVIGKDNQLPWHLPDDMQYFKKLTEGHTVVMGRRNYESLPSRFKPLPNRTNIVMTRNTKFIDRNCIVTHSIAEALSRVDLTQEIFIIGGEQIYVAMLYLANRLYLTEIQAIIEGDTFFPFIDHTQWKETKRQHHLADDRHQYAFDFVVYERIKKVVYEDFSTKFTLKPNA